LKKSSGISPETNPPPLVAAKDFAKSKQKVLYIGRIIDANLNRVKEGLRVCEEITRFILDNHKFTAQLKEARHKIDCLGAKIYSPAKLLSQRRAQTDVGRFNSCGETKRGNCKDIFRANIQRVKESLRVLEEFSKLLDLKVALGFKQLRYKVYEIEKESFKKISCLPDSR
jgi:thiamine-phosphate pyrophosphorylase